MTTLHEAAFPRIVSQAEWKASHDALRAREKAATKARDALAAERQPFAHDPNQPNAGCAGCTLFVAA